METAPERGGAAAYLDVEEVEQGGSVRLTVTGELDLASAPVLRRRLEELFEERRSVLLDLSELAFIDSTGIHLITDALGLPQQDGWDLRISENLSRQVRRVFQIVGLDLVIVGQHGSRR